MSKEKVQIIEVGPRDGLQNEKRILDTEVKISFIEQLVEANLKQIEVTSFVRPSSIPQMSDSLELFEKMNKVNDAFYIGLVPNMKGLENALKVGNRWAALFTATSETFNQKNINASIEESLERFEPVIKKAKSEKTFVRGYISTVFGCPYEGKTSVKKCLELIDFFLSQDCYEVSLGDTTGVANPKQVQEILREVDKNFGLEKIAMHFHDTRGLALANTLASLEAGVRRFDSSAGGIGGCPYALGATGNVATEDVYYLMESMGLDTGINIDKLFEASSYILNHLGKESNSKYHQYLKRIKA